jgi:succinoglycan biosynthesis protein ExoA
VTFVASVVVPVRDEASDIESCLDLIADQDVGAQALEVILADGRSQDDTVAVATAAAARHSFGRFEVVDNPAGRTAAGLHRALQAVTSDYVVRVDARSRIASDHVRRAIATLAQRPDVGVVGGAQVPIDRGTGTIAAGIARALANRYTTGLSRYRRTERSGSADTVWMGAFRTDDLRALGGWDPGHGINEDYELNSRFRSTGQIVWFDGEMPAGYLPRGDLGSLGRQYYAFGHAKGAQWASGGRPAVRQLVLLAAPPVTAGAFLAAISAWGTPRTIVASALTLAAVDHLGAKDSSARPAVRLAAVAAMLTSSAAWWTGVILGWADRRHRNGPPVEARS